MLHLFLPYAGILGRIIGRYVGVKAIVSTQCNLPLAYSPKIYWLDKLTLFWGLYGLSNGGIELLYGGSVSKFSKSIWEEGRRHFTVVAGVDLSVFDGRVLSTDRNEKRQEVGIPQEAKLAMMISRMISWKGHTDLVSAMKFLP